MLDINSHDVCKKNIKNKPVPHHHHDMSTQ